MSTASVEPSGVGRRGLPLGRFVFVMALVGLDLWTKSLAFDWLAPGVEGVARDPHGHLRYALYEPWFGFMLSCNPGAAFGQLGNFPYALVIGRFLAIALIAFLLWREERVNWLSLAAMVLVLAGAVGNVADNLGLGCFEQEHPFHLVRDFIDVWFKSERLGWDWHFPTFNVADSCITVGAVCWITAGFVHDRGGGGSRGGVAGESGASGEGAGQEAAETAETPPPGAGRVDGG